MNETQTSKGDGVYIRTRGNVGATSVMAVITAFLFLSLASPAVAADQVPFKGRLEGSVAVTVTVPPFASVFAEGTGNATHLGRFTWEFPHMVNQAIQRWGRDLHLDGRQRRHGDDRRHWYGDTDRARRS